VAGGACVVGGARAAEGAQIQWCSCCGSEAHAARADPTRATGAVARDPNPDPIWATGFSLFLLFI
jgi:hypothetical protein